MQMKHLGRLLAFAATLFALSSVDGVTGSAQDPREALRRRVQHDVLVLPKDARTDQDAPLTPERFLELVASEEVGFLNIANGAESVTALVGQKKFEYDRTNGSLVVHDERGYEAALSLDEPEGETISRATSLLAAFGIDMTQAHARLTRLGATDKDLGQRPDSPTGTTHRRVATRVVVDRYINQVPVRGQRLVVSYATDGSLRRVIGHWREFDYRVGKLTLGMSAAELTERALDELQRVQRENNVRTVDGSAIWLTTVYEPRLDKSGLWTIDLKGEVSFEVHGPDGGSRITKLTFVP